MCNRYKSNQIAMAGSRNIFKVVPNDLSPRPGRLLISEPLLQDVYFQRSVVLLVEHSAETGSMGFILNKKTELTMDTVFPELKGLPDIAIYFGGPVAANRLFFVHSLGDLIVPNAVRINEHLYFDGDFEALKAYILAGFDIADKVKFFIGYSGWEKHQLRQEIKSNSWAVGHDDDEHVLSDGGEAFWKSSVVNLGEDYKLWTRYPKDLFLN